MSDHKTASLELAILDKACEGERPYHAIREAVEDAKSRAALALYDGKIGAAGDAIRDLHAALAARETLVAIGGPDAIAVAGKMRDKRERAEEQKELDAKRQAEEAARKKRADTAAKKAGAGSGGKKHPPRSQVARKPASRPQGMIKPKS